MLDDKWVLYTSIVDIGLLLALTMSLVGVLLHTYYLLALSDDSKAHAGTSGQQMLHPCLALW